MVRWRREQERRERPGCSPGLRGVRHPSLKTTGTHRFETAHSVAVYGGKHGVSTVGSDGKVRWEGSDPVTWEHWAPRLAAPAPKPFPAQTFHSEEKESPRGHWSGESLPGRGPAGTLQPVHVASSLGPSADYGAEPRNLVGVGRDSPFPSRSVFITLETTPTESRDHKPRLQPGREALLFGCCVS